ncbi:MAG: hypothetical protein EHM78_01485 [Myxococcaceae bacterium]|jgi:uncharacterized membrane protein|nr:MAG: hypothetical protein EHM78_01485 [Myxococcaceae bacterium]
MSSEPSALLLFLKTFHAVAVIGWMAGQLCIWRLYVRSGIGPRGTSLQPVPGVDRRGLHAMTTLAASLALFSGAGLIAL